MAAGSCCRALRIGSLQAEGRAANGSSTELLLERVASASMELPGGWRREGTDSGDRGADNANGREPEALNVATLCFGACVAVRRAESSEG